MAIYPFTAYSLELDWTWQAYSEVIASTLMIYDWSLTLDREIDMFWGKRRSWTTILFFVNRYTQFVAQPFNMYSHMSPDVTYTVCKFAFSYWVIGFGMTQLLATDMIIFVRVRALYSDRRLHKFLIGLLVAATLGSAAIIGAVGSHTKGTADPYPKTRQCTVTTEFGFLWAFWLPILAYEGFTFYLLAAKAFQYLREGRHGWRSSLIQVLLRDALLYFPAMFALLIGNAVLFSRKDPSVAGILESITTVLISHMGSRMLLNMQEELAVKEDPDLSTPSRHTGAIGFGLATGAAHTEIDVMHETVTAHQASHVGGVDNTVTV